MKGQAFPAVLRGVGQKEEGPSKPAGPELLPSSAAGVPLLVPSLGTGFCKECLQS